MIIVHLFHVVLILLAAGIIGITLLLNTKSEGLGAAITGASDTYRGAVGVEEQKRFLLRNLCYTFLILCLVYSLLGNFI
jgi:protein translocase SecG subunit